MKAFILAHILLAPFIIFTIGAPLGYSSASALIGLVVGVMICAFRYGTQIPPAFMSSQLLGLTLVVVILMTSSTLTESKGLAIVFAFLTSGALISVIQSKPWTMELSAGGMRDFAKTTAFKKANNLFSIMWALIYAWFSFASWIELPQVVRWIPFALGGIISVVGPKILMKIGIKRGMFEDPLSE